ncbi:hypothetical protein GS3922_02220 [Geobacillus subterraneus]|uniref:Uncharacterized protein n=3 Tax=Anoxybacillaceae TaxID=3120669 RepID=A0ABN4NDI1_9BACL|nr:hypothetical protein GS3922_02220 [Geobacillus subterraneus]KZS26964.1 hypothetical protein A5418_06380 [Geobacillus subterraneus]OXB90670.1 hypothetical protein B9L21_02005 [Geobacillus uzenensis]
MLGPQRESIRQTGRHKECRRKQARVALRGRFGGKTWITRGERKEAGGERGCPAAMPEQAGVRS